MNSLYLKKITGNSSKEFNMKNKIRFLLAAALAVVIVFTTATCGNGTTGGGNSGGGNGVTPQPEEPTSWKPPPVTDFMKANGAKFYGDFRFSGSNIAEWRFNTELGEIYSQKEVEDTVANAVKYTRLRVLRTHMVGSYFEPSIGTYNACHSSTRLFTQNYLWARKNR
jgi:hypothetical protein